MARFVPKMGALYEVRRMPVVKVELRKKAQKVLDAAGGHAAGYATSERQGEKRPQGRWRVNVYTATRAARRDNAQNNTLLRNLNRARD